MSSEDHVTYLAPPPLDGATQLHIEYFPDQRVARVDVELAAPIERSAMAERLGTRVHQEQDDSGRLVEYFFPSLLALVHRGTSARTPVMAVAYLSPRRMADVFCERARDALTTESFARALTE